MYRIFSNQFLNVSKVSIKVTNREKASSNKTQAFTKSMNMDIWVIGTSNQLFIRGYLLN